MEIELSNGQLKFWQWDTGQKIRVPENVPTVHFKFGKSAVEFPVENQWVEVPDELLQTGKDILLWTYNEDHTLDAARIPVEKRPKPAGYAYTPTEIKTWEQLDARIEALEKGGGVAGVTSVNGKTGAVKLTAEDVGAASKEYVNNNSKLFVINITDSLNDSNDKVYSADKTYNEILEALNNGLLPVCKMPKHIIGSYVYGLCYFSGKLTPPIGSDCLFFRSLDTDALNSKRTAVSIALSNYVEVTSEQVIMTGATDSRSGVPGYVPVPQSSERNYFLRGDARWKPALQPPAIASVGQYLSVKTVDDNGIVTETEAVDAPSAGDLSLGLTGATVGQTVKISAVDETGVPTAWEPVDMASEETWEKIADVALTADVSSYQLADFGTYRKVKALISRSAYVSGLKKNVWFRVGRTTAESNAIAATYVTSDYGYIALEINAEMGNMFTNVGVLRTNNRLSQQSVARTIDVVSPENPSGYGLYMVFTDTSVIQSGDTVTVYGVKR